MGAQSPPEILHFAAVGIPALEAEVVMFFDETIARRAPKCGVTCSIPIRLARDRSRLPFGADFP